jgi:hypothetical protein
MAVAALINKNKTKHKSACPGPLSNRHKQKEKKEDGNDRRKKARKTREKTRRKNQTKKTDEKTRQTKVGHTLRTSNGAHFLRGANGTRAHADAQTVYTRVDQRRGLHRQHKWEKLNMKPDSKKEFISDAACTVNTNGKSSQHETGQ